MERTVFNKAQLELLDIMSTINSEEELRELKHVISEYYAKKADEELLKLEKEGKLDGILEDDPGEMHYRTPYKQ